MLHQVPVVRQMPVVRPTTWAPAAGHAASGASLRATCLAPGRPGGFPPGAPTDPDMRNSRIRLVGARVRYAGRVRPERCGLGSGYRSSSRTISVQLRDPRWDRRLSH